jgi:radical SAM superfamily enzyme YgiQ (UPF0313 family)
LARALLIRPDFDFSKIYSNAPPIASDPPLGLGYIASFLRENGHKVYIADLNLLKIQNKKIHKIISKFKPDIIGVSAVTYYYSGMKELCTHLPREVPIVLGGVHISALPEYSFNECNPHYLVIGEGEVTFLELIESLKTEVDPAEINGIAYKRNNELHFTPKREMIQNLDDLPFPAWDLMNPRKYKMMGVALGTFHKRYPTAPIITTRGCPYSCKYCASTRFWGKKFRRRSPQNVVDEIQYLVDHFGVREIHIQDDNFTLNKKHVIDICHEVIKRKLDVIFNCPNGVRIDHLNKEILSIMKRAGFYSITVGIESGSQRVLNTIKKQLDLKTVKDILGTAKELGYFLQAYFMIGLPSDNYETIRETIDYSLKIPIDKPKYLLTQPLPGSELFDQWAKNKDLNNFNWDSIYFFGADYNLSSIPTKDLEKFQRYAFLRYFFRPRTFIKNLADRFKIFNVRNIPEIIALYLGFLKKGKIKSRKKQTTK